LLYNLPYIHRAYILSYRNTTELFIPIKNASYICKDDDNGKEGWLQFELDKKYDNGSFIKTLPDGYEKSHNPKYKEQKKFIVRTTKRINFRHQENDKDIEKVSDLHRQYRLNTFYIAGNYRLWYLKRKVANCKIINRYSPTITFAIMHRLSELSRYNPERFEDIIGTQMSWIINEFITRAPFQFIDEIISEITGQEIMPPMIRS